MSRPAFPLLLLITLLGIPAVSFAQLSDWTWRNPLPQGATIRGLAYGGDRFVAVGVKGLILTSDDASHWTPRNLSSTAVNLYSVAYGNNRFVAVGVEGETQGVIYTSADGVAWTKTASTPYQLFKISYGNGTFVAAGIGILASTDGSQWQAADVSPRNYVHGLDFANGRFFALLYSDEIWSSVDGLSWSTARSGSGPILASTAWGNGTFVTVGSGAVQTSIDGNSWNESQPFGTQIMYGVAFADGRFVAVGAGGRQMSSAYFSNDGQTWERASGIPAGQFLFQVARGQGKFVAVGSSGNILISDTGENWNSISTSSFVGLSGVAGGPGKFVAVGSDANGRGAVLNSSDGRIWTSASPATQSRLEDVIFAANKFVAVGENGTVITSTDGVSWTAQTTGISVRLRGITYGNGLFVAVGTFTILTSTDGVVWTSRSCPGLDWTYLCAVAYGNNRFVAVGEGMEGGGVVSDDGIHWFYASASGGGGLVFGNGVFLVGSGFVNTRWSSDGVNWNDASAAVGAVGFGDGLFVGVAGAKTSVSTDGIHWTERSFPPADQIGRVDFAGGRFFATGVGGALLDAMRMEVAPSVRLTRVSPAGTELELRTEPGRGFMLQISPDLKTWSDLMAFTNSTFSSSINHSCEHRSCFYRLVPR